MGRKKPAKSLELKQDTKKEGSLKDVISKMRAKDLVELLKNHEQLKNCSKLKAAARPKEGEMVWARALGSVFWPAFIAHVEDIAGVDVDGSDIVDDDAYTFVMFLEDAFRIAPIAWDGIIPFKDVDAQIVLVPEYNKLIVKRNWRPQQSYRRSLGIVREFLALVPEERQPLAISKYNENFASRKTPTTPQKPPVISSEDPKQVTQKLKQDAKRRKANGLRVSDRIVRNEVTKSLVVESHPTAAEKTESPPEVKTIAKLKPSKNSRPVVGGETMKQWTAERFATFDKQFCFESTRPVRCHLCTEPFKENEEVKTCHGLPHHFTCLTLQEGDPPVLKCRMCIDKHCFICKMAVNKTNAVAMKCSRCDLRFHIDCLERWPQAEIQGSNGPITCPLHFCHTCLGEQRIYNKVRDFTVTPSRAYRCFICLSTYHKACLPAGCGEDIEGKEYITCPKHKLPTLKVQQRRIGCLTCCKPLKPKEERVECSLCIQVFHPDCVGYSDQLKTKGVTVQVFGEGYNCVSCTWGLFPVYGQVVWFQQPMSQYWPARILYPKETRRRNSAAKRLCGQYSIEYFGSTSYYDNASRVMPLHLTTVQIFKKMKVYHDIPKIQRAHEEAAFCLLSADAYRDSLLPPPKPVYKKIEKNVYRGTTYSKEKEQSDICSCHEESETGLVCLAESGCTNRDMAMECSDKTCKGADRCTNRMFRDRKNDEDFIQQKLFLKKGWGVVAMKDFKPGDFVAEYRGEVIDREEKDWRLNRKVEEDPLYILEIEKAFYIDAEFVGNMSRLINHSCDPNCEVRKYLSMGRNVGGIFAIKEIGRGEEVTFRYGYGNESTAPFRCRCGASSCSVFIGKDVPDDFQVEEDIEHNTDKWDDVCFKCGFGGDVICCEFPQCRKVGHIQCVGLSRAPQGYWGCPEHMKPKDGKRKRVSHGPRKMKDKASLPKPTSPNLSQISSEQLVTPPATPKERSSKPVAVQKSVAPGPNQPPVAELTPKQKTSSKGTVESEDITQPPFKKQKMTKPITYVGNSASSCSEAEDAPPSMPPPSNQVVGGKQRTARSDFLKKMDKSGTVEVNNVVITPRSRVTMAERRQKRHSEPPPSAGSDKRKMLIPIRSRRSTSNVADSKLNKGTGSKRVSNDLEVENKRTSKRRSRSTEGSAMGIVSPATTEELTPAAVSSEPRSINTRTRNSISRRKKPGVEPFAPLPFNSWLQTFSPPVHPTASPIQNDKPTELAVRMNTRSSSMSNLNSQLLPEFQPPSETTGINGFDSYYIYAPGEEQLMNLKDEHVDESERSDPAVVDAPQTGKKKRKRRRNADKEIMMALEEMNQQEGVDCLLEKINQQAYKGRAARFQMN